MFNMINFTEPDVQKLFLILSKHLKIIYEKHYDKLKQEGQNQDFYFNIQCLLFNGGQYREALGKMMINLIYLI